jgi:hypothetical protein
MRCGRPQWHLLHDDGHAHMNKNSVERLSKKLLLLESVRHHGGGILYIAE